MNDNLNYLFQYFLVIQSDIGLLLLLATILSATILIISVKNPIHAILLLISVFFLGTVYLFLSSMEYFALLFLTVYVGAIVVLFLFMIMMLDIKMINVVQHYDIKDALSFRTILFTICAIEIAWIYLYQKNSLLCASFGDYDMISEANSYVNYSQYIQRISHLKIFGVLIFTEYKVSLILATLLLLLAMIGSIALLLEDTHRIKNQNPNLQALKLPNLKKWSSFFWAK